MRPEHQEPDSDTMTVAPPDLRERLLVARRARENELRSSVEIPRPPARELPPETKEGNPETPN